MLIGLGHERNRDVGLDGGRGTTATVPDEGRAESAIAAGAEETGRVFRRETALVQIYAEERGEAGHVGLGSVRNQGDRHGRHLADAVQGSRGRQGGSIARIR